jgi:phosphotriesterase-related protein
LEGEIIPGGIQAGFIKLSAGDDGLTPVEEKILHAAGRAGRDCNAAIGSHTIRGRVVRDQLAVLGEVGYPLDRFIWIHANVEPDVEINLEMARRGVWIEYDGIGSDQSDVDFISRILTLLDAGLGGRILLSQDRGWYDPARPNGGKPRPFTYITEKFLPMLGAAGVDEATLRRLTCDNPFNAFAR